MFKNRTLQVKMVKTPNGEPEGPVDVADKEAQLILIGAAVQTVTYDVAKVVGAVMALNTALKIVESHLSK